MRFGIRILVDIALMALSPAINDPYTAVQCLDQLAALMTELSQCQNGPVAVPDRADSPRVLLHGPSLADYLDDATREIVPYSSKSPEVLRAVEQLPQTGGALRKDGV